MDVDPELVERVKAEKSHRAESEHQYLDRARVAFIVHSFNRLVNIDQIVAGLRRVDGHELIVCDDGSGDGSREKWAAHLSRPNDFLIQSNDLHEIRILDRAVRFASSDVVCLVQDDDAIPENTDWLDRVLVQFDRHPDLAIVGGFMGLLGFDLDASRVRTYWSEGPFRFVDRVNIGPYFIRRAHYDSLGGWDFSFSDVGEPGICFDDELCLRAWLRGFKVGYQFVPFKGPAGHYDEGGGTMLFSPEARHRNQWDNHQRMWAKYGHRSPDITALVNRANQQIGISEDP